MQPPQRKPNRLPQYNYNTPGAYFITICTQNREPILCKITAAPQSNDNIVGDDIRAAGTSAPTIQLTQYGIIVEQTLQSIHLDDIYASVDKYVIMPDHIHFILTVGDDVLGVPLNARDVPSNTTISNPPQTQIVPRIITWFKRLTNQQIGFPI